MTARPSLWLGALGVLLSLVISARYCTGERGGSGSDEVASRDLIFGAQTEGELEAVESVRLGPPNVERMWRFRIARLTPEGTEVEPGAPLVVFDTSELERRLVEARTESAASAKQVEKVRTDLDVEKRQLELRLEEARGRLRRAELKSDSDEGVTARAELEKAAIDLALSRREIDHLESLIVELARKTELEIELYEGRRRVSQAKVSRLEQNIEALTVRAPRAGTLLWRADRRGNKREVGDDVWKADKVVEIPDLSQMRAMVRVDEAQAGRVAVGQRAILTLDAFPDREILGRVSHVRSAVQRKSQDDPTRVVELQVDLDETDPERMRPGMRVRGTVVTDAAEGALAVPTGAVHTDAEGAFVVVDSLFGTRRVYAEFGRSNREYTEVLAGLSAGDRVLRHHEEEDDAT